MTVPLLDLKAQYATIGEQLEAEVLEVMRSARYVMGPKVEQLEQQVADYVGAKYGVGCASGTDALLLALMALDIGPGSAVITTPYTFFSTVSSITRLGALPLFADIEPRTYNIDPAQVAQILEQCDRDIEGRAVHRPSGRVVEALLPVHLFGQAADSDALLELCQRYDVALVEDAAQAIGTRDAAERMAGSIGLLACFSFFPSKNLGGLGDGGMITTDDELLAQRLRALRSHGAAVKYYHDEVGINSRLDALQAAVLSIKLQYLESWHAGRIANADRYRALLDRPELRGKVEAPLAPQKGRHIYNQFVVRAQRRDELRSFLQSRGIGCEIYYPLPLHLQRCFAFLGHSVGSLPNSELAAEQTLALPVYPELSDEQAAQVVEAMVDFYRSGE
ncbi:MAG: DegT/DnrJ/EryC1/StrS family aminotransferase [Candidatus Alcyoniella australis]|nr:DegT/DnrJ/EryC1/StrS family aminotransferase [Candidatus Alcyoniella australis]